jgi:hypothetical protein
VFGGLVLSSFGEEGVMHWSAILLMAVAGPNSGMEVAHTAASDTYSSYTQAWHAAHDAERPMLVILNPAAGQGKKSIVPDQLFSDKSIQPLLNEYVVAVIDTGTEHGKKVHELFGNAPLPRVVVIDKEQKEQVFVTSGDVSAPQLAHVLDEHKDDVPSASQIKAQIPAGSCPNCQRRFVYPTRR